MKNIEEINKESVKKILTTKKIPEFFAGDTIKVGVRIAEGIRERIQYFEGVCIAKKNRSINSSFTVRKISFGEGVERTFALYSSIIGSIKVIRSGQVRRAKLYYLRDRKGKSARISEKIKKKIGIDVTEQVVENEIVKKELTKENFVKDKDIDLKAKPKKEFITSIMKSVEQINPTLEKHERLEKVVVMKEDWTVANGLATPSLKVKRSAIEKIHQDFYKSWFDMDEKVIFE